VAEVVTAGVQVEVRTPPATSVLTRTLSATNAVTTPSLRRGENDDQALVRRGFRHMVDAAGDMEVLGEAADGLRLSPSPASSNPTWCLWTSACESSMGSWRGVYLRLNRRWMIGIGGGEHSS
jgi:hypothetical protein